jgi:hypothetical protein
LQKKALLLQKKIAHKEQCLTIISIFAALTFKIVIIDMDTIKKKRTREEVRAAFREYLNDRKKRTEEKQHELEEIHQMRMSGMTMEEIFA